MRDRARRNVLALALGTLLACTLSSTGAPRAEEKDTPRSRDAAGILPLSRDLAVRIARGREIELVVHPRKDDDYDSIASRFTGRAEQASRLASLNGDRPGAPPDRVGIPLAMLADSYRRLVLRNLFPVDRRDGDDWIHVARSGALPTYDEGLWQLAEWFTGRGENFEELMQVNGLKSPELAADQAVRIPARLLHPALVPRMMSDGGVLSFSADSRGPFAAYPLKPGEAVYSSVIVRFTGRTQAEDVSTIAEQLRRRSDIGDLHDIPVGFEVKIPLDMLEPDFLPAGHPRRREAEAARVELERELERAPVAGTRDGLAGVVVVLDPGHGGRDLGTINNGIWEHDYVYDVACRLKHKLERETAARVLLTLEDRQTGCSPSARDKLNANHQGTIQTDPPFLATKKGQAKLGVNLRWYLANSIYGKEVKNGTDADRVVFVSLHADSRHASLRGVMVYVPGAAYRTRTYGFNTKFYNQFREVRERRHVRFSKKDRVRSEAVSRKFADSVVDAFGDTGLPVQPYQPVRNRIIRGKSRYVPAVIRNNTIPNKVLIEMVNLSNREDAALLASARHRDRLATAVQRALFDYFGEDPGPLASARP
ncbi:MAG: hypothetical protein GY716_10375 [bacterium]|nr:hypothetical protein [bacterium]